jgi:hypothetical protein
MDGQILLSFSLSKSPNKEQELNMLKLQENSIEFSHYRNYWINKENGKINTFSGIIPYPVPFHNIGQLKNPRPVVSVGIYWNNSFEFKLQFPSEIKEIAVFSQAISLLE